MAYVPAWRKRQLEKEMTSPLPLHLVRKPRFLGNALGLSNVAENTGIRYMPRSPSAMPATQIMKLVPGIKPNSKPPLTPTHDLRKIQPLFRHDVLRSMRKTRKLLKKQLKHKELRKGLSTKNIRKMMK
jgi:hypothetical protein